MSAEAHPPEPDPAHKKAEGAPTEPAKKADDAAAKKPDATKAADPKPASKTAPSLTEGAPRRDTRVKEGVREGTNALEGIGWKTYLAIAAVLAAGLGTAGYFAFRKSGSSYYGEISGQRAANPTLDDIRNPGISNGILIEGTMTKIEFLGDIRLKNGGMILLDNSGNKYPAKIIGQDNWSDQGDHFLVDLTLASHIDPATPLIIEAKGVKIRKDGSFITLGHYKPGKH